MRKVTVRIREHGHFASSYYVYADDALTAILLAFRLAAQIGHGIGRCRVRVFAGHDAYYSPDETVYGDTREYDLHADSHNRQCWC